MIRILGLGNELVADDGCGIAAATRIGHQCGEGVEVVTSAGAGLDLLEHLAGARRVLVVDTLVTGMSPPGTVHEFDAAALAPAHGGSAHYVGLAEALALGRAVGLPMPDEVRILAMEPADCLTIGGGLTSPVLAALPGLVARGREVLAEWERGPTTETS